MKNDQFFQAYIEAALWSSMDNANDQGGEPLDANYSADDIAPETLAKMRSDCELFQVENETLLDRYYAELPSSEWSPEEQGGHDFWLSRNGHGAGFFDREVSKAVRDALQEKARQCGEFDLYVGDDDLIYA